MKRHILNTSPAAFILAGAVLLHSLAALPASAQCCGRTSVNQPRIVGGSTAVRTAYPWMTALVERGQNPQAGQFCGGALIAPQWILTAAHCIEDTTAARLDVIVGAYNLTETNGGGQRIQVIQIIAHPSYGDINGTLSNDLALLKLATPVTGITPIRLIDSATRTAAGQPCRGMGWGATSEGGSTSSVLLQVDMGFFSLATANTVYGSLTDAHLAAGIAAGGRDTCQGDSGGPLVVPDGAGGWFHAGVVSFGDGCARANVPGVYTNTLKYAPWILQTTGTTTPPATDDFGNTVALATARTFGTAIAGRLEASGDIDVFKFTTTGAGTITATSTGTTALTVQWLNSAGAVLTTQTGAPGVNLAALVTAAGTYYLSVKGSTTATTGNYSVNATFSAPPTGAPEANLTGAGSVAIPDGDTTPTTAKGTAFPTLTTGATASQVFTITNAGTAPLTVGSAQITGTGAAQFSITVQPPASIAAGRTGTFTVAFSPKAAGTHTADISFSNNDANENPYNFRITGSATAPAGTGDDHGNTQTTATTLTIPGTRAGVIEKSLDVDMFKFTLAATTTVTLRTTGSIDTYATLYNSSGRVIAEADDASSTNMNFSLRRSLAAGTYYLAVDGYDAKVTGAYTLEAIR